MKKLLFFFIFLIMPYVNVCAQEKDIEKEYRYYYIEKEYSKDFYEDGKGVKDYPFKSDIFVYDFNLRESFDKPSYEEDIVNEVPVVKYQEYEKVRYIMIDNFKSGQAINLQEVEVFASGKKVGYIVKCPECSSEYFAKIQNTLRGYEKNYISGNEEMIFDLQDEYFPDDLEIVLHFGGNPGYNVSFDVTVNNTKDWNDKYYYYHKDIPLTVFVTEKQALKDIEHEERLSSDIKEKEGLDTVNNAKILDKRIKYQYKTRLYQYYKENKIYIDGYYKDLPGLIKDEENFVIKEKTKEVPKTITEYIEKEVLVPVIETKEIPVIEEKTEYLTKTITKEVEVPKEVIKEVEVIKEKEDKTNYLLSYSIYLVAGIILKKMSVFKL